MEKQPLWKYLAALAVLAIGAFGFYDTYLKDMTTTKYYIELNGKDYQMKGSKIYSDIYPDGYHYAVFGPQQQLYFHNLIWTAKKSIDSDATPAIKKKTWIDASNKLCSDKSFNAFGIKKDWIGRVWDVGMNDKGETNLTLRFDPYKNDLTQYNLPKNWEDFLLSLKKGDFVRFSGNFFEGKRSQNECLYASGLGADPFLTSKGFRFKFSEIKKINIKKVEEKKF